MDFLAKVVLNLLRSLFLFNRATEKNTDPCTKAHLSGKSVEEDFESLKHCLSLRDKGKNFVLRWKINSSSDFDVSLEAIEKMRKEFDLGEDFFNVPSSFELLFRNIANEQVCSNIKYEGLSDLLEGNTDLIF